MPTYEYVCRSCGTHVEVYQRFSDAPLTECGVCGGPLRKVFHPAGILFKGSGFYATDSRSGAASKSSSEEPKKERKEGAKEPAGGGKEKTATSKEKSASTSKEKSA